MKRICLLGAALAAVLILGVASALAATPHAAKGSKKSKTPATVTTKVSCTSALSLQVASGDTDVVPASQTGNWMGSTKCNPSAVGSGVQSLTYSTDDAGDLTGKWQAWFSTGTAFGTFTLTPDDNGPPTTTTTFSAASYTGTFIVKGGKGAFAKATGTGTLKCATQDGVHFTCKQGGKVITPAPATTTTTKKS